jgi:hypothetical protein
MTDLFTVEEVNLMCIFDTSGRTALMAELIERITEFDDDELFEIAHSALEKLSAMSDAEFAALELYPEYGDYETEEV